jgi:ligand-binding sensor domain-containing protein/signal transduction histidine kinase/DNA-binding response OmpR family regulator
MFEEVKLCQINQVAKEILVPFLFFFACLSPAFCQQNKFAFRHLTVSDGLSKSSVISIVQDQQGFMWFGTRDGLNRYDGHKVKVYKHDNSIPHSISNNDITRVVVDSRGDLWVGTFNGLNKYDYSQDKFITYYKEAGDVTTLSDNTVRAICESNNGDLWIGTSNGLNRFNRATGTFEAFFHDDQDAFSISNNHVQDIFEDKEGFIWVATARGLNKMDISSTGNIRFTRLLHEPGNSNSLSDDNTQSVREDREGNLWVGTSLGGLNKYDKNTGKFESFLLDSLPDKSIRNNDVRALAFDEQGRLWIGAYTGLYLLDIRNNRFHRMLNDKDDPTSLSNNSVKSVFVDRVGTLWIGTYYGGVNMLDEQNHNFRNFKCQSGLSGLTYEVISAIVEDVEGRIYVGTEGGGINILDLRSGAYKTMINREAENSLSSNNIKSLYLEDENNLWIGTYRGGLNILDLRSGKIKNYRNEINNESSLANDNVYSILQENDSLFWLGLFGGGLNLFNKNNEMFFRISKGSDKGLTSEQVRVLFKDSQGNLWVGTPGGLNFLSAENLASFNFQFKTYFYDSKKGSGEDIQAIYEDSRSGIWVGTKESGLNLFDPASDKFVNYILNDNSAPGNNVVNGILEDENGWLWISTNQGIVKYNPDVGTIKRFVESDGLLSNEFNINSCLKNRNGFMYFGSLKGLTTFHPDRISTNQSVPSVIFTDFKLYGQSLRPQEEEGILAKAISYTREITLDYDQANFSIEFSIPNFINPQKNHYAYRLNGLEEKWNYTSNHFASYILQNPGTYLFEVKGANNDGIWNNEPTTLKIKVNPAPWRTWWAFLFYAVSICIALYLLIKIIISSSRLKHALEIEQLNQQKQELLNQSKLQFFTNVSHEFRTPLTLILGPLEEIISSYKGNNALYRELQSIEKNASRLLNLVDQLMDLRKFENKHLQLKVSEGNIVEFVKDIYLSFIQYARIHKFSYEFDSEVDELLLWYDRDKLERVVFNLISNAFKYTSDGGQIKVMVRQVSGGAEIEIVDSGVGIAPEHLEKIFERFYEVSHSDSIFSTKYNRGTGIGLALAKGIIDMHSGEIKVKSIESEGSTFTIQLPLGSKHLSEDQINKNFKKRNELVSYEVKNYLADIHPDPDVSVELSPAELSKNAPTILVVEDNDDVRNYIVQVFRAEYRIIEASNGKEGLKMALQHVPDMIISDVMMPETDGVEFCFRIKSEIRTSHIPFVLLTARTSLAFKYEGLEMGADDYIQKPFKVKELKIKVKNLIQSRKKLKEKFSSESLLKPSDIIVSSLDEKLLKKALQIVEENISNELFEISTFSEELGISRTMLFSKIKAWTNLTPSDFVTVMRMKRAAQLLEQNKLTVSQVAFQVGYKNPKYFSKCFQRHFSETPTSYAKKFFSPEEEVDI